ncbi:serine/threonine-protein kinase Sgk2 [Trichoderma barbatum]
MTVTEQQIKVIAERPFNDTLNHFGDKLRDLDGSDPRQEDVAGLLAALVGSPAAFSLTLPDGTTAAIKLMSMLQHLRGGGVKLDHFRPLVYHVIENHQTKIAPTFKGTPVKSSSSRLADSETRDIIEGESWREQQKKTLEEMMTEHDGKTWTGFPSVSDEKLVWDWLRSLEERFFIDAPYKLHTTTTANQFKERKGQMDLSFQTPTTKGSGAFEFKDVLVVGEQKKSYDSGRFKSDFLQLARYVRGVFADSPTRRFVHGFTLCASIMELWVFDRSGAYSSGSFDIHDEPDKFARALVGYGTMDNDTMGLDTFIERADGHRYVTLDGANSNEKMIRLGRPIVRQKAIVCRGTTCFETRNGHVAKFSWASDKRKLEVEHLKLAEERGVQGVARVVAHRQITTIAELRERLQFPERHRFRNEDLHFDEPPSTGRQTSSRKRKSWSDNTSDHTSGSKRLRFNSGRSKHVTAVSDQLSTSKTRLSLYTPNEDLWENRIYSCIVVSPAGRVISSFNTVKELLESLRDAIKAHRSLYMTGNILHRDISSNNIIITKPGAEDGFKGMLIDLDLAKVRDNGPSGARHQTGTMQFMAVEVLRTVDHTYRHDLESFFYVLIWMCGRESWAKSHLARGELPPKDSRLRQWEIGSFRVIADAKEYHMTGTGLQKIMWEIPEALDIVKPLCVKIRKILFPLDEDEVVNLGTPIGDPDQLYRPIIEAYDEAISLL